jgi:alkanesulfonate monooxygenase SsuD/methylene tetrahydromethanopterin reductase-like flavin-dependent oxidoreductase (luciferase family)
MAIAARETKKCRILALGNPVANRPDPVRVAMEMAMIDVISHGRLECGFIKGVSYEMSAVNSRPSDITERQYEAIDLIVKAWTSHDGPFSWEGKHFHHRQVNIVPRPYQQPHPTIWVTAVSPGSTIPVARRGYTFATMFNGTQACKSLFETYRREHLATFGVPAHPEQLAYSAFCFVGETDEEAVREAPKIQDFLLQSLRVPKGQLDVPGYIDPKARAAAFKQRAESGSTKGIYDNDLGTTPAQDLIDAGIGFFGSPDSVFEQLKAFFYAVGGFGNFMGMFQASTMSYALTVKSLKLFSEEVLPRFRAEVYEPWLKEQGLKLNLLPQALRDGPADAGIAATSAITGQSRAA